MEALEKLEKRAAARGLTLKEMASVSVSEAQLSHLWKPKNANKLKVAQEVLDALDCDELKPKNADKLEIAQEALAASDYDERGVPSGIHATEENLLGGGGSDCVSPRMKRPKLEVPDPEIEK
ncbi:unnamed protein product [Vicia faba]|uniref:HTH cro/C1-type domain-containing protein n=1 Tax=Vicia faba TaxID=3906 RepID=A0AAV0YM50_VICFA|nr:unnamed protein product [Vicia faba]